MRLFEEYKILGNLKSENIPRVQIHPIEMPWTETSVPHGTIEVNQACNLNCRGCYKQKNSFSKPLEQIKREIDLIATKRNLESLTILGGEPMLHKELSEISSYISQKNIMPILLTNGSLLNEERLNYLKKSGLKGVRIHIDSEQGRRPDLASHSQQEYHQLRMKYVQLIKDAGLEPSLAITLYKSNFPEFQNVLDYCQKNDVRDILVTLYQQTINASFKRGDNDYLSVKMNEIISFLDQQYGFQPAWYIPSENSPSLRWIFYFGIFTKTAKNDVSYRIFFQPKHQLALKIIPKMSSLFGRTHTFHKIVRSQRKLHILLMIYASLSFSMTTIFKALRLRKIARKNNHLSILRFTIQQLPHIEVDGSFDPCKNCPDITIRNGQLIPVCVADHISPIRSN